MVRLLRCIVVALAGSLLSACFVCPQDDELSAFSPFLLYLCTSFEPLAKGSVDAEAYDRALAQVLPESTGGPELLAQMDALDAYLTRLAGQASPSLAAAVAAERAKRPPLASLVGLDMNAFRAAVLPLDRLFRDAFESEQ